MLDLFISMSTFVFLSQPDQTSLLCQFRSSYWLSLHVQASGAFGKCWWGLSTFGLLAALKTFFIQEVHAYICACLCVCDCGYVIVCVSILLFCTIIQPTQIIMTSMDAVCSCVCFLAIISRGTFFFPLNFKVTARYEEFILVVKTENFQFLFQQTC